MSAILKFDFQKGKQLRFSEVYYLNYIKRPNFVCDNYIFPKGKQEQAVPASSGPIPHPLTMVVTVNSVWPGSCFLPFNCYIFEKSGCKKKKKKKKPLVTIKLKESACRVIASNVCPIFND